MTSVETRNLERASLFLMAAMAIPGVAEPVRVRVRNLSAGGAQVESDLPVRKGAAVVVELRNVGTVPGTVAWVRGKLCGVAFEHQIDPKLARTQVYGGEKEAPVYARAAIAAPRYDGWNGKMRRV